MTSWEVIARATDRSRARAVREAVSFCVRPSGHATTATLFRCGLNFVVPFLVSNAGLLGARK